MTRVNASLGPRAAADARAILRLGLPLLVNNLSIAGMGAIDTVMAGQLGARALASVAVGVSYYQVFFVFGLGVMMALSPLVAHAYGAGDARRVGAMARQGAWLVLALGVVLVAALAGVGPFLRLIGIAPDVLPDAIGYVHAMACGLPAALAFQALRFTSEGIGRTRPMMYVALGGFAVNVAGNWMFMYGHLGMPALGAVGTGVATAMVSWFMFIAMTVHVARAAAYRPYGLFAAHDWPSAARLGEILALGLPIAGSMIAEGGLFSAAGLIMGTLGRTIVAAHQIALNYASFMFMAPLAMHSATTIHVGHALGRGDRSAGRLAGWVGIGLCGALMTVSALVLVVARGAIAALYTRDPAVLALATHLLLLAAAFQVSDGLQVGAMGALRGFKDTRVPLAITVASYWLLGFPVAFVGGVLRGGGPVWVWCGLIAGLALSGLALALRYALITRRAVPPARPL